MSRGFQVWKFLPSAGWKPPSKFKVGILIHTYNHVLTCSTHENPIFKLALIFILSNLAFLMANSSAWASGSFCNLKKYFWSSYVFLESYISTPFIRFFSYLEASTIFLQLIFFFECINCRIRHTIFTIKPNYFQKQCCLSSFFLT